MTMNISCHFPNWAGLDSYKDWGYCCKIWKRTDLCYSFFPCTVFVSDTEKKVLHPFIWITRSYWGLFWDETHPALPFSSFCVTPLTNQPTDRAHRCSWTHNPLSRSNQLTFKQSPVLLIFPLGVTLTIHFKCNPYKICHPTLDFYQSDNVSVHRSCSFNVTMVNTPSTLARRNWLKSERAVI